MKRCSVSIVSSFRGKKGITDEITIQTITLPGRCRYGWKLAMDCVSVSIPKLNNLYLRIPLNTATHSG
ncbi:MAG: hypothetical protein PF637_07350 [Spirochaetes bacterium]|nr:hypothetical protein [Spirochaetota bacterium]